MSDQLMCLKRSPTQLLLRQAITYLNSNEDIQAVDDQVDAARKRGISGVPVLVIEGKWLISGGQTRDVYLQVNYLSTLVPDSSRLTCIETFSYDADLQEDGELQRVHRQHVQSRIYCQGPLRKDRRVKWSCDPLISFEPSLPVLPVYWISSHTPPPLNLRHLICL